MFWSLLPPEIADLFNIGRAKFTYLERDGQSATETKRLLLRQKPIPIYTHGWHSDLISQQVTVPAPSGTSGEIPASYEARAKHAEDSKRIERDYGGDTPRTVTQNTAFSTVSFYVKRTQAYYTRLALEEEGYHLLKVPRAANSPRKRSAIDRVVTPSPRNKRKPRKHKRPGRL